MNASASVLQVGDWVHVDGEDHQVVALSGTSVRLLSASGAASVVLASFLLGALDFALVKATTTPRRVEPFGLLEGLTLAFFGRPQARRRVPTDSAAAAASA